MIPPLSRPFPRTVYMLWDPVEEEYHCSHRGLSMWRRMQDVASVKRNQYSEELRNRLELQEFTLVPKEKKSEEKTGATSNTSLGD